MKNSIKYLSLLLLSTLLTNCDADFGNINKSPNAVTTIKSENLFHNVVGYLGTPISGEFEYIAPMMQYTATTNGNFNIPGNTYTIDGTAMSIYSGIWRSYSMDYMRYLNLIEQQLGEEENTISKKAQITILKALLLAQFSDTYGPIPFDQAGNALEGVIYPVYRSERDVYLGTSEFKGVLDMLDEAIRELQNTTDELFPEDILYNGERSKWVKFASSVLLRNAMKISDIEAEIAKNYMGKAVAYGLITGNEDIAKINHMAPTVGQPGYLDNSVATSLINLEKQRGYCYGASFITALKKFNDKAIDPRLKAMAGVYDENGKFYDNYEDYEGMKNGCEMDDVEDVIAGMNFDEDFTPGIGRKGFASFKIETILNRSAYYILLGAAEVNFLLAEASLRGFISGDPKEYYKEGIQSSMESMTFYGYTINSAEITDYLTTLPELGSNKSLNLRDAQDEIITQKWLAMFGNSMQTWCDWRRTHYPSIITDHPNTNKLGITNQRLPGRLPYPQDEEVRNKENNTNGVQMLSNKSNDYMNDLWWAKSYFKK